MLQSALICTFVFWLAGAMDFTCFSWALFTRPLICGPITGLLLGDLRTGIIMGGAIEGIYMGVSNIGGSTPADPCPATIIAVAYSILTGSDIATGVMLSLPIGTLMQSFTNILTPFYASLSVYWEKLAASGNTKKMGRQVVLFDLFLQRIAQMLVLFLSIAYGIEGIQTVFNSLPGWVLNGFNAASGMMTAVGFAILMTMIWSKEVGGFFFVGFVLAKYLGLGTLPIAILLAVVALCVFLNEKRFIEISAVSKNVKESQEEDFF